MGGAESAWLGWIFAGRLRPRDRIVPERGDPPRAARRVDRAPALALPRLPDADRGVATTCRCSPTSGCAGAAATAASRISPRYPLIELACGLAFVALFAAHGLSVETLLWWAFAAALIAAAGVDFDHGFIPDELSLGGLALGLARAAAAARARWRALRLGARELGARRRARRGRALDASASPTRASPSRSAGASRTGRARARSSRARSSLDYWIWFPGLGFGDVKLIGMVGAFLGPVGVVQTILLASLLGLPLGLWLTRARGLAAPFGFGPAIALAALAVAVVAPLGVWPL